MLDAKSSTCQDGPRDFHEEDRERDVVSKEWSRRVSVQSHSSRIEKDELQTC